MGAILPIYIERVLRGKARVPFEILYSLGDERVLVETLTIVQEAMTRPGPFDTATIV